MPPHPATRTTYLDNLRSFLTVLVIYHHASLPYGGVGNTFYQPRPAYSSLALTGFNIANQTFFMGTFFLLSGYYSAAAASRKSRTRFLEGKWKRLGVPAVVGTVVGVGVGRAMVDRIVKRRAWGEVLGEAIEEVRRTRGVRGAVWYCAVLGTFDCVYVLFRAGDFGTSGKKALERKEGGDGMMGSQIETRRVLVALAATSLASFVIRYWYPIGTAFELLGVNLGYMPQYALAYAIGIWACRSGRDLAHLVTSWTRFILLVIGTGATILGMGLLKRDVDNGSFLIEEVFELARGGFNKYALLYSFCNEFVGAWIASGSLVMFERRLDGAWVVGNFDLARHSYATFLVHSSVLLFVQCLLHRREAGSVWMALLTGSIAVPTSWGTGWSLIKLSEGLGAIGYV
jgi:glucans biosynthesis protein C